MSKVEVKIPDIGDASDVEVIEVLVAKGDSVAAEDSLIVLESDKASMDVPSPQAGKVVDIVVNVGDKVSEGDLILHLDVEGDASESESESESSAAGGPKDQGSETPQNASESSASEEASVAKGGESKVQTIEVPDLGGFEDVPIIEINVAVGDRVAVEDPLLTLESDKATMEVPAPVAGTVQKILVAVDDKVSEGSAIIELEVAGDESAPAAGASDAPEKPSKEVASPASKEKKEASSSGGMKTVTVPDIGGYEDVSIIEINVAEGDEVQAEDPLLVLESDKATMEVPSPYAGTVRKVLVQQHGTVSEGTPIVEMEVAGGASSSSQDDGGTVADKPSPATQKATSQRASAESQSEQDVSEKPVTSGKVHAGPAVRKLAREFGVDLAQVPGSGPKQRILKEDVQKFVKSGMQQLRKGGGAVVSGSGAGLPTVELPDFTKFGEVERAPMSRIHQLTAENMARSWLTVPHVTQFDEADITELESFRKGQKAVAERKGVKLTPLPFLIKACAYALEAYPHFNISLDMEKKEVVKKRYVHIGMAVDTPAGLVVPVIRDVDKKGLWQIARECADLAAKAKDKKLKPSEMQGGCFTISSLGSIGGTGFTPIVNTPEVAILGVSKAQMKPVYDGNGFTPRLMLPLCLSYDHRAINGADAARFTALLAEVLGDLRQMLL